MLKSLSTSPVNPRNEKNFCKILESLKAHVSQHNLLDIKQLFVKDQRRFHDFSCKANDILVDYSKMPLDQQALDLLLSLANAAGVGELRQQMFNGTKINLSEKRSVLHTALRLPETAKLELDGKNIVEEVHNVLKRMEQFSTAILKQHYLGYTGKPITDIVNIGIGGSDLGPRMVCQALKPYAGDLRCHFVSNIDAADISDCLASLNAETTLFIITSKSFTTLETLTNADWAKNWLTLNISKEAVSKHFVAVTSAVTQAGEFGITRENCFAFWDWVGGRYSVWSAVGLPIMLYIGIQNFRLFLQGAQHMDQHFIEAAPSQNAPLLLGLIDYYKRACCDFMTTAIVPYEQRLKFLPLYLQQLCMESNGKGAKGDGQPLSSPCGSIIWGATGTNGQHAFFQFLHQSADIVPVEFIVFAKGHELDAFSLKQHNMLLANCLAQSEALLSGEVIAQAISDYTRYFSGNRPSITIACEKLTPYCLGQLLAMYEHRVFVEGVLLNINSFDQWGVELGKAVAQNLFHYIDKSAEQSCSDDIAATSRSSSTDGLLAFLQKVNAIN